MKSSILVNFRCWAQFCVKLGPNGAQTGLDVPKSYIFEPYSKTVQYFFLISSLKVKAYEHFYNFNNLIWIGPKLNVFIIKKFLFFVTGLIMFRLFKQFVGDHESLLVFFDVCTISLDITKKCNPKFSLDRRGLGRVLYLTPVLSKWPQLSGAIPVSISIWERMGFLALEVGGKGGKSFLKCLSSHFTPF